MDFSRDESFLGRHGRRSLQHYDSSLLDSSSLSQSIRGEQIGKSNKRHSTALNVQKSIQLLDESVGSPMNRSQHTPGGSLKYGTYTPRLLASGSKFDVSSRMGPTPKKTPQGKRSLHRSFHEESFQTTRHGNSVLSAFPEEPTEEITTTNIGLLLEEDPGISASRGLFEGFLESLQSHTSQGNLFHLVEEYEKLCQEQSIMLKKLLGHAVKQEQKFQKTHHVLDLLRQEEATWKLVMSLYKDRLETSLKEEMMMDDEMGDQQLEGVYQSDLKIAESLFERDQSVREGQLVVDWLENCAQDYLDSFAEVIKFFSDKAVGYENARHRLQNRRSDLPVGSERPLVTELDPDAPLRQNKPLDDLDKEDEDRLLQYILICLRAGQLEKAQKICTDSGQAIIAATLEGWKLYHDPNFSGLGPECQKSPVQGNQHRDIWKIVCWNMTQDPRISTLEKAIYSVHSGNLRALLPVCKSWSDYLWAYFRVYVDQKVEEELRLRVKRSLVSLPGEYWDKNLDLKTIFKEIEANESVNREAQTWYRIIQKHIILGDTTGLLEILHDRLRSQRQDISMHLLRFMAHFVLFLRTAEQDTKEDACNSFLEAYVQELIKEKQYGLVAYYVAKLPLDAQVHWYAQFLEGISDKEEKQRYLDLAERAGLDLAQITKRVVENIRNKSDMDFTRLQLVQQDAVDMSVSEEDRRKIESIDWLVFDVSQRAEAMKQANAVLRSFIALKKLVAAKEVLNKLPPDSIDIIHRIWLQQTGTTNLPQEDKNAIREYLCIKAYLDAMESFNDWFEHYHHGKPARPGPPQGGSFTDKVAYEHRLKQFEQEEERWYHNLLIQTQTTKEYMYNVLLFADGGWMLDQEPEEEEDMVETRSEENILRQEQMDRLRQLVLPSLTFLLHNMLHTSEQYKECVQLADIIAGEQRKLYEVFRKDELQRLLKLIRESSLKLLDNNCGPLGFELS